jgi:phosphatidate cytidylyltransferase
MIDENNKNEIIDSSAPSENDKMQNKKEEKQPKKRSALAVRSFTAIFIAILYVAPIMLSFFVDAHFYDALILFLSFAAAYEFVRAISAKYDKPVELFVYAFIAVGYAAFKLVYHFAIKGVGAASVYFIALALVFVVCAAFVMFNKKYSVGNLISTLFAMIYPSLMLAYALLINYFSVSNARIGILLLFIVTTLTDTMAYFVGSIVKGPKLCPTISPKKTISGAIGGLLGGIGGGVIVYFIANAGVFDLSPLTTAIVPNALHFIFLGFGAALFCQIGDLVASYVKRAIGIKDYGKLLKGHGGFMDRIDGLMFSALFIYIYLTILGLAL